MRDSRTDLELISRDGKLQTWKYYKDHNTDAMGGIDATTTKVYLQNMGLGIQEDGVYYTLFL